MDKKHRHPGAKLVAPLDPSRRRALMRLGAAGIATAALAGRSRPRRRSGHGTADRG